MKAKKLTSKTALRLAQAYVAKRAERLIQDGIAEQLKEEEIKLKQQLMDTMEAIGVKAVGDGVRNYALHTVDEPTVADWDTLKAHIRKTGEFELLYQRVNPGSVKERWDLGIAVPGVQKFPVLKLSVTKAKGT
jgi:hypothetical protein